MQRSFRHIKPTGFYFRLDRPVATSPQTPIKPKHSGKSHSPSGIKNPTLYSVQNCTFAQAKTTNLNQPTPNMKGILIVNMGGPQSLAEMRTFLWKMFTDKHILPFAAPFRYSLAWIITTARYKKSWAKYESIGGTPLVRTTEEIAKSLAQALPNNYKIRVAYSYNNPFIADELAKFAADSILDVEVVSLYPHYSITTLQSVKDDAESAAYKLGISLRVALPYYDNSHYIQFWVNNLRKHIVEQSYKMPLLIFSGHSIPNSFLDKGDCYPNEIEESARLIATELGLAYRVSYQSQIGKKWLGPITEELLAQMATQKPDQEIVIVPISFVNENLETLYDIDQLIIPTAKALGIKSISKVPIPEADTDFVAALADTIQQNRFYNCGHSCKLCGKSFNPEVPDDAARKKHIPTYCCTRIPNGR
jgi:ferrochelatase